MRVNFPDDYARILECKLPKLTLQPVVENAIFHGLEAKSRRWSYHHFTGDDREETSDQYS